MAWGKAYGGGAIPVALGLAGLCLPAAADSELYWQNLVCPRLGYDVTDAANMITTPAGRTIESDCVSESEVVEVDFARKYYEGLAQSEIYAAWSGKAPVLVLIARRDTDCRYVRDARAIVNRLQKQTRIVVAGTVGCD